ncbi:MAG: hypothetical protein ACE5IK_12085 [Acidobacteriota bacterium]
MAIRIQPPAPSGRRRLPGRRAFRFSFSDAEKYRAADPGGAEKPPLLRRWEAVGLLLLVTVGAAFVPVAGQAAATRLIHLAAGGTTPIGLLSAAPPLLALMFAWRASGRLVRPFTRLGPFALVATLSALAVFLAFHLGLYLAFAAASIDGRPEPGLWIRTVPGALAGWGTLMIVAVIRLGARAAARDLDAARTTMQLLDHDRD